MHRNPDFVKYVDIYTIGKYITKHKTVKQGFTEVSLTFGSTGNLQGIFGIEMIEAL